MPMRGKITVRFPLNPFSFSLKSLSFNCLHYCSYFAYSTYAFKSVAVYSILDRFVSIFHITLDSSVIGDVYGKDIV